MLFGIDLPELLKAVGILGIAAIVLFESGVPFGFFLPGDSLLFTAGVLSAAGFLNLPLLILAVVAAAILGVNIGYAIGKRYGRRLFSKEDSLLFHKDHVRRAEEFYEQYGGRAIVLARFLPVVRTFAPIVAGIAHMNYRRFMYFNVLGALLWGLGLTVLGYALGNIIPAEIMEKFLILIIVAIIVLSFLPTVLHIWLDRRKKAQKID